MANRIEITQWREIGDNEDTLFVSPYPAETDSRKDFLRRVAELCEWTLDADGEIVVDEDVNDYTVINEQTIEDGEVLEHNGRKFQIRITEVID